MSDRQSYEYKFHILYERTRKRVGDPSRRFAEYLCKELENVEQGVKGYIADRDAPPNLDMFDGFAEAVKKSQYTICVFDEPFLKSQFRKYQNKSAFLYLLENHTGPKKRFIPVAVGVEVEDILKQCTNLDTAEIEEVSEDYTTDQGWLDRIKQVLFEQVQLPGAANNFPTRVSADGEEGAYMMCPNTSNQSGQMEVEDESDPYSGGDLK